MRHESWDDRQVSGSAMIAEYEADRFAIRLRTKAFPENAPKNTDAIDIRIRDISTGGFMGECASRIPIGSTISIAFPEFDTIKAIIVWAHPGRLGARFTSPIQIDQLVKNFACFPSHCKD
jgi:hypothetical protein